MVARDIILSFIQGMVWFNRVGFRAGANTVWGRSVANSLILTKASPVNLSPSLSESKR